MKSQNHYIDASKAWRKSQVALIKTLANSIRFSMKDIELTQIRIDAQREQLRHEVKTLAAFDKEFKASQKK